MGRMAVAAEPISAPNVTLPAELPADVLILPRKTDDGQGLYDDSVVTVAKELRAAGATAEYQHDAGSRKWIGEKALTPLEVDLIAGIATNAGWAAIATVLGRRKARVRARLARCAKTPSGTQWEWFEVEGSGTEVADTVKSLQSERRNGAPLDEGDGQVE